MLTLKSPLESEKKSVSIYLLALLLCMCFGHDEGYWVSRNGIQLNDKETQIQVSACVSTCDLWVQAPAIVSGGLGEW